MLPIHLDRGELVDAVCSTIDSTAIAVINGPRYIGKSTLAADSVRALGGSWAWIDAGINSATTVRQATHELRSVADTICGIVIDGLPQNDAHTTSELLHLVEFCRAAHISAIFIPVGEFASLTKQRLGLRAEMEVAVGPFNNAEISTLLLGLGCPEARLQTWVRALDFTTAGDPVLVVGRIASIERAGFPEPSIEDFGPRPEVEELRRNVRLIAASDLEKSHFEMLSRLSISFDAYSRRVAMRLADEHPAIPVPGNALDALTGIWVQEIAEQRYRIIGLALDFGKQTYGDQWVSNMHQVAGRAILEQSRITTLDGANALSHAFAGADADTAVRILHQVIQLDGDLLDDFSKNATWLPMYYIGEVQRPDFLLREDLWILRAAQIRIGARTSSGIPQGVFEAFDAETPSGSAEKSMRLARLVVLTEILIRTRTANLPPYLVVRYGLEWAELAKEFTSNDVLANALVAIHGSNRMPREPGLYIIGFSTLATVKSTSSLSEIIAALRAYGSTVMAAFLGAANDDRQIAYGFLLPLWSRYLGNEDPGYEIAAEQLEISAEPLLAAGLTTLADEVLAAAVRLMAERASPAVALQHADRQLIAVDGLILASLCRARARALMLNLEYAEAAQTWENVLPQANWDGSDFDLYSDYRDAAISYARVNAWSNAAEMLMAGAARVDQNSLGKWKAAMEIDAAAAFFRAKRYDSAVAPLLRGCAILSDTEIDQSADADYMIMKRIGHVVFWMTDPRGQSKKDFDAPPAAAASWLDVSRPQIDLPPTEVDMVLALASQYAYMYGSQEEATLFENRILRSAHAIARLQGFAVSVFQMAEAGDGVGLVSSLAGLRQASDEIERSDPASPRGRSLFIELMFAFGLIVPGLQNGIDTEFITSIRERAQEVGLYDDLKQVIDQADQVFVARTFDPEEQLYAATGTLQILFSIAYAATLGERPEPWAAVHTLWAELALQTFHQPAGAFLYRLFCERWKLLAQNRICLSRPAITVPRLLTALSSHGPPWNKIALILEAAADAVGSTLPARVRHALDDVIYNPA